MSKEVEVLSKEDTGNGAVIAVETTNKDLAIIGDLGFLAIDPSLLGGSAQVVDLGVKVKSQGLEKYRGEEGRKDRIAFLIGTPIVLKYHYFQGGIGYIQCFGGKCCDEDTSNVKVRYLFPIIKYIRIGEHKISEKHGFEIQVLSAGAELYENIIAIHQTMIEDGDKHGILGVDFTVNCTDTDFQKLMLTPTKKALWKEDPVIVDYLKENWSTIQKEIPTSIAKEISPEKFEKLLNLANAENAEVDEDDEVDEKPAKKKDKKKYIEEDDE